MRGHPAARGELPGWIVAVRHEEDEAAMAYNHPLPSASQYT